MTDHEKMAVAIVIRDTIATEFGALRAAMQTVNSAAEALDRAAEDLGLLAKPYEHVNVALMVKVHRQNLQKHAQELRNMMLRAASDVPAPAKIES